MYIYISIIIRNLLSVLVYLFAIIANNLNSICTNYKH